jgi:GntR family transcriptional regulator, carbon starvation induced regulator
MNAKTQSDQMFERLHADILLCRIAPGSKVRISDIAESAEVSLGAVREALSRLGAEGLVIAEPQKGYRVSPVSIEDLCDLTEARVEIERIALSRSIERGDLEWETRLVAAWHRLSKTRQPQPTDPDALRWGIAHADFHQALVAACGSSKLLQVRSQLYQQAERYRCFSGTVDRERNVFAEHQAIFSAAIARDMKSAAEAIEEHLRTTTKIIVSSFAFREQDGEKQRKAL